MIKSHLYKFPPVHLLERHENDLEDGGRAVEDGGLGGGPADLIRDVDHLPLRDQDLDSLRPRPRHERHQEGRPAQLVLGVGHHTALVTRPLGEMSCVNTVTCDDVSPG